MISRKCLSIIYVKEKTFVILENNGLEPKQPYSLTLTEKNNNMSSWILFQQQ
jgi:hypothetical protein